MKQQYRKYWKYWKRSILLILGFTLVFFLFLLVKSAGRIFHSNEVKKQGIEVVKQLESADVATVLTQIEQVQASLATLEDDSYQISEEELENKKLEWINQLELEQVPEISTEESEEIRTKFAETVFFGDSMTQAIGEYGLIDLSRIVYQRSAYIALLREDISQVIGMYPRQVVLFTGLNDCSYYDDVQNYVQDYNDMINEIKAALPDVKIVVCSVLPPNDGLKAIRSDLARASEFDAALEAKCQEQGWTYIDTKWMVNQNLYLEDEIHFNLSFYQVWIRYLNLIL